MPVDTQHPEYVASRKKWQRMRDSVAGDDAVQSAGQRYLPALSGQSPEEYAAYLRRATFFGATGRTSHALHGLIFRKAAVVEAPASLLPVFEDITMSGKSVSDLAQDIARELIDVGRVGVLVDFPAVAEGQTPSNAAQAGALGLRPFASVYKAESVLNWATTRIRNASQLAFLCLDESGLVQGTASDPYAYELVERIRIVKLDADGLYVQEVHEKGAGGWALVSTVAPMSSGKRLDSIPFVVATSAGLTADVSDPPMLDLADVNLSHFRTSADLEHGAHFTGLPTPWVTGYTARTDANGNAVAEKFSIGSSSAWVFPGADVTVGYLEFSGDGLGSLERLMDRKEHQMSALGARMLSGQKAGVESTGALEIRTNGETSVLAGIATTTSRAVTKICQLIADWAGVAGRVSVTVNTDFMPSSMSPQLAAQLFGMVQAGAISPQSFFWNMQAGELIPEGKTFEEEQAQIDAATPALPPLSAPAPAAAA